LKPVLAAAVALILQASASEAEEAFHCPEPGTVLTYSEGTSLTFTSQEGLTCRARTNKGALVSQFLGLPAPSVDLEKNHGEGLFPWRVGNQVEFMTSGSTASSTGVLVDTIKDVYYDNTVKVLGQEKLVTAAGTFDTFVIEWHRQARGRWLGAWASTIWFAPQLGYWIKFKHETRQGYGPETSFELASIAAPRESAAPSVRALPAPQPTAAPAAPNATNAGAVDAIKLEAGNGTFLVPVQINGKMTLNFVLDSGAADVAIPADVVQMLTRAGTVSSADFIGTKTYVLADGSKLPSEAFIVHELRIGNHVVNNVTASVVPIQGKLLLGQSLLSRFPAWTIDNKQHALVILGEPATSGSSPGADRAAPPAQIAWTPPAPAAAIPVQPAAPAPAVPAKPAPAPAPGPSLNASPAVATPPTAVAAAPPPAAAGNAVADAGFRCPKPGTLIQYSNGASLKFSSESGFRCAYVDQYYKGAEKFAAFTDDARFLDAGLDKLWPLTPGKVQTVTVSASGAYLNNRFTVLRSETISTRRDLRHRRRGAGGDRLGDPVGEAPVLVFAGDRIDCEIDVHRPQDGRYSDPRREWERQPGTWGLPGRARRQARRQIAVKLPGSLFASRFPSHGREARLELTTLRKTSP
jgi:clan AA aspartic protease (TIGR02281 family)